MSPSSLVQGVTSPLSQLALLGEISVRMRFLCALRRFYNVPRSSDILRELASFGEMPVRNIRAAPASHKRDRDETQEYIPSSASPERRPPEDNVSRLFKPIPRVRQPSPPKVGGVPNAPVTSVPLLPQNHPMPPIVVSTNSARGPRASHFLGPTGGVAIPPSTDAVEYPSAQDNAVPSMASISGYFDAAFLRSLPLSNNAGVPFTSTQPPDAQMPSQHPWEGILSQQQQNPYGTNVATPGILVPDYFNPYIGYQGAGGPLGFAVEAQAFMDSEDTANLQDPLGVGCALNLITILEISRA